MSASDFDRVVTTVVRRRVRPERRSDYERWLERLQHDAADLDGFLGAETFSPPGLDPVYTSIFRFATLQHRDEFERSDLNRRALTEVTDYVDSDPIWDTYTGLELWFAPPPGTVAPQPVRWRMATLLGVVVYVLVLIFGSIAAVVIGDVPAPLRLAVVIAIEITLMTYVILPVLTRRLARWIYPSVRQS